MKAKLNHTKAILYHLKYTPRIVNNLHAIFGKFVNTETNRTKFYGVRYYPGMPQPEIVDSNLKFVPTQDLANLA